MEISSSDPRIAASESSRAHALPFGAYSDLKARRADEMPMRSDLTLSPHLLEQLGHIHSGAGSQRSRDAMACVVANVVSAHVIGMRRVFYSRDSAFYAAFRTIALNNAKFFTLVHITGAIEALESAGFLYHEKTSPSPRAKYRSTIAATPELLVAFATISISDVMIQPSPVVVLRGRDKRARPLPKHPKVRRLWRDVDEQNAAVCSYDLAVVHPEVVEDQHGILIARGQRLNPGELRYRRIFNSNLDRGGRWYGPYWQQLPKDVRAGIRLNGKQTGELDFRGCHIRLLAAMANVDLPFDDPDFDPYVIPNCDRSVTKLVFNVALNTTSPRQTINAAAKELAARGLANPRGLAKTAFAALIEQYPELERFWSSGIGLRLQALDADLCARIQRRFRERGLPILSVHDSFVVQNDELDYLKNVMEEEMRRACGQIRQRHEAV